MPTRLFRFERIPAIEPPLVGDRMCNLIVVHCLGLHGCWDCMIALFAVGRETWSAALVAKWIATDMDVIK